MKASIKNIKQLATDLKKSFVDGNESGRYSDKLEKIVLGFENVSRSDTNEVIIYSKGKFYSLWIDVM